MSSDAVLCLLPPGLVPRLEGAALLVLGLLGLLYCRVVARWLGQPYGLVRWIADSIIARGGCLAQMLRSYFFVHGWILWLVLEVLTIGVGSLVVRQGHW